MLLSREQILRGGSKLELARALLETEYSRYVPESAFLYSGQDIGSIESSIQSILRKGRAIVRASSMFDWHGFVDVIPSFPNITSMEDIEGKIKRIESEAKDDEVKFHLEDWNQNADIPDDWKLPYSSEVHVLIQKQNPSGIIGSMRNPHTGDLYISYDSREYTKSQRVHAYAFIKENKFQHNSWRRNSLEDKKMHELIELYEQIEKTLDASYVYHMEFGLNPLQIFQLKPFKEKKPCENFKIECDQSIIFDCFGITPEEGIVLELQTVNETRQIIPSKNYGVNLTESPRYSPSLEPLGNLRLYLTESTYFEFLSHADYRLMKMAKFSGLCPMGIPLTKNARYISNGKKAAVFPA